MTAPKLSISSELIRSAKWSVIATVVRQLASFATIVILARFVVPADFGQAAIVLSISALLLLLGQFGFAQAIVGVKDVSKRMLDSIFTLAVVSATVLYIVLAAAARPIAAFYHDPALAPMLLVIGWGLYITLIGAIPAALLQRKLDYKVQAYIAMATAVSSLLAVIVLAVNGAGVWALLLSSMVGGLVGGVWAFLASAYVPALGFDAGEMRRSMNFGVSAFISNAANFFCNNAVPLVMGKVWSASTLGIYKFASTNQARFFDLVATQIAGNVFPIFSKISDDLARMRSAFLRLLRLSLYVLLPAHILLIIAAPDLFLFLFGATWMEAVLPFQILILGSLARSFNIISNPTLYALRRPDLSAKVVIVRVVGYGAVMLAAVLGATSLVETTVGVTLVEIVVIALYIIVTLKMLRCSLMEYLRAVRRPLLVSIALGAVTVGGLHWVGGATRGGIVTLAFIAAIGCGYLLIGAKFLPEMGELIRRGGFSRAR